MEDKNSISLFDSTNLVLFLWKKRKYILIVTGLAFISSIIFSSEYFIRPKYKSTVILFPSTNSSISKALISENFFEKENVLKFGNEEQVEQTLQILYSDEVKDRIISKYNLINHYRIDKDGDFPQTELNRKFDENISFNRTEYLSVEIEVLDESPDTAALIANEIADLLDTVKTRMQHDRARKALAIVEKEFFDFKNYLQMREDTLSQLRELGVLDYEKQVERLSEAYGKALIAGSNSIVKTIDEKMQILSTHGGKFLAIKQDMLHDRLIFSKLKSKYDEAKVDATQVLPQKFIVSTAKPAEKKSYPVRWLIVLVSTVATLLLSIVLLLLLENIQRLRYTSRV